MSANLPEIARGGWRNCETPWLVDRVEAVEASLDTTRGIKKRGCQSQQRMSMVVEANADRSLFTCEDGKGLRCAKKCLGHRPARGSSVIHTIILQAPSKPFTCEYTNIIEAVLHNMS
jgi:hypothetical protein